MSKTEKSAHTPGIENAGKAASGNEQILPCDTAAYIHEMAIELKDIAETARLSFLAYLLDLVIEESAMQKRGRL